jgi:hypothetical protein
MHGSRTKIPSKNLVRQRSAEGFNFDFKGIRKLVVINGKELTIKKS